MVSKVDQQKLKVLQKQLAKYEQQERKLYAAVMKERKKTGEVSVKHQQAVKELDTTLLYLRREILALVETMEKKARKT